MSEYWGFSGEDYDRDERQYECQECEEKDKEKEFAACLYEELRDVLWSPDKLDMRQLQSIMRELGDYFEISNPDWEPLIQRKAYCPCARLSELVEQE